MNVAEFAEWGKLSEAEQTTVKNETNDVLSYLKSEAHTKLAIGESLLKIQAVLLPKRIFVKYLKYAFHMSKNTAYRYIELYSEGRQLLPEPVLEQAVSRGTKLRKEIISLNPPPKTANPVEISSYLDKLDSIKPEPKAASVDNDTLAKEALNFVSLRWDRVTGNKRTKDAWVKQFLGMLATKFGVDEVTVKAVPIPENFVARPGRPKLVAA